MLSTTSSPFSTGDTRLQGPWPEGMEWTYVARPTEDWLGSDARHNQGEHRSPGGTPAVDSEKPFTHEQRVPLT